MTVGQSCLFQKLGNKKGNGNQRIPVICHLPNIAMIQLFLLLGRMSRQPSILLRLGTLKRGS